MFNLISPGRIIGIRYSKTAGLNGWVLLPNRCSLNINLGVDWCEQEIFSFGPFALVREYTEEEQEEMRAMALWEEQEANRYTEWSY
jgi:hypothetical protein